MARRMLIDATHDEETRVTVVNGNRLEEFDYETESKRQLKGNIYLAKVTRVEPSLQACFVDYGGNRHGFLAFSEIHPDYYRIPVSDRDDLVEDDQTDEDDDDTNDSTDTENGAPVEELGGDEGSDEAQEQTAKRRPRLKRQYKIQEVIKRRQVILVQVVKEERGNKGAALTTYLSLAGRYCVLMPNTSRGGGVSRKITNVADRKRLKSVVAELKIPQGMAVIVRTAGAGRTKTEVKRDFEYITRLWDQIRTNTLEATAPSLIHEEANLIKRSIRDLYTKEIEEVLVAGDVSYRTAKDFMKTLMPSHAKKVQPYKDDNGIPLFQRYQVESQLSAIHEPTVNLRSGGSIVMNQTEALVAIDVNSGRATKERHIEETALKTNLEAAEEIARQLRLRDMAGLIVIDFIDMDDNRNDAQVERKLKESLRKDRARIQVGRISPFGLLEMSRQRLRPSLLEAISQTCPTCSGTGYIQSTDSSALNVLRTIEEEGLRRRTAFLTVTVNPDVAMYILNSKRASLAEMEENYGYKVTISVDTKMLPTEFNLEREGELEGEALIKDVEPIQSDEETQEQEQSEGKSRKRRRRRRGRKRDDDRDQNQEEENLDDTESSEDIDSEHEDSDDNNQRKRRKRGRRGGRRRNRNRNDQEDNLNDDNFSEDGSEGQAPDDSSSESDVSDKSDEESDEKPKRNRGRRTNRHPANRRGNRRDRKQDDANDGENETPKTDETPAIAAEAAVEGVSQIVEEKPRKVRRRKVPIEVVEADVTEAAKVTPSEETPQTDGVATLEDATEEKPVKKTRAKKASAKKSSAKKASSKKASTKKTSAKKATAKKTRAKKASAKKVEAAEATPVASMTEAPKAEAAPKPAPAPEAPKAEPAPSPASEAPAESNQPKRKGWWSRVIGS
ncbi:Rne/Rng family ribonuclease [Curvivirga aplysinae]|uniref:Rne/Rng family ribonuclease n=1 Tax=Curvivirga aplysinae TaxID=2529852 RepID=UPI0012BD3AEB|nr:ribonuclease E/G [Curvivirga aplysinae]MTI09703.1 Rne/Rng family ribonuclease [Curvivirga aplysinae]